MLILEWMGPEGGGGELSEREMGKPGNVLQS